jgi:serine protease Do
MADRSRCLPPRLRRVIPIYWIALWAWVIASRPLAGSDLRQTPVVKAVQEAAPAVVNIRGEKTLQANVSQIADGEAPRRVNGMGTGVIIDPRGYILTNHHVIDGVRQIQVRLADQRGYVAKLIQRDSETDLAIIKIDPDEPLPVIKLGTSSDLMPGEPVIAVGNAFGYEHTVTRGIISALGRAVRVSEAQYYDDLIQTDASINPGNSGGPLLNIDGEMVGVNVAVRAGAVGIGFAIPVDKAAAVAARLLARESLKSGWHGVELADDAPRQGPGSLVATVAEESPAQQAGLRPGDVITAMGDLEIVRPLDFQRAILGLENGQSVDVLVRRGDETLNLTLRLAAVPGHLLPPENPYWARLGLELQPLAAEDFHRRYRTRYHGGLDVVAVRPDSPAAHQGIRRGDVLVGMHIWQTVSLANLDYILNRPDLATFNPVKFFILRGDRTFFGRLPVPVAMASSRQR